MLSEEALEEVYDAIIRAKLDRSALLSGIDREYTTALPHLTQYNAQIKCDLDELNSIPELTDGTTPLKSWLTNARQLTKVTREHDTFQRALNDVNARIVLLRSRSDPDGAYTKVASDTYIRDIVTGEIDNRATKSRLEPETATRTPMTGTFRAVEQSAPSSLAMNKSRAAANATTGHAAISMFRASTPAPKVSSPAAAAAQDEPAITARYPWRRRNSFLLGVLCGLVIGVGLGASLTVTVTAQQSRPIGMPPDAGVSDALGDVLSDTSTDTALDAPPDSPTDSAQRDAPALPPAPPEAICPPGMVLINGTMSDSGIEGETFCIHKTEVTLGAYRACVEKRKCTPAIDDGTAYKSWSGEEQLHCLFDDGAAQDPANAVNCIGWGQAETYCSEQGWRLPSEREWMYTVMGNDPEHVYPWGKEAPESDKNLCWREKARNQPCEVDEATDDKTMLGVLGMAANVAEWVTFMDANQPAHALKGGYFGVAVGTEQLQRMRADKKGWVLSHPRALSSFTGFRCAASARHGR
jgi:Sulfatase-modifying factor enzyme 1/Effector-associated domain 5